MALSATHTTVSFTDSVGDHAALATAITAATASVADRQVVSIALASDGTDLWALVTFSDPK